MRYGRVKNKANMELCYTKSSIPFIGDTITRFWLAEGRVIALNVLNL
jgi:hypothetical protein